MSTSKKPSTKKAEKVLSSSSRWCIVTGELKRSPGRPSSYTSLFKIVGEKIPTEFLSVVATEFQKKTIMPNGVYIAHDSMGYPRYIGRGNIFDRLRARMKAQPLELCYFSFFVVESKVHEREIETIMIRAAGPLLDFNTRKVRNDIEPGDVKHFEAGTRYVERQYKKGKKAAVQAAAKAT